MRRVLRGGSWDFNQGNSLAGFRDPTLPDLRYDNLGLRLVVAQVPIL